MAHGGMWLLDDQVSAQSLYGQDFAVMIKSISQGSVLDKPRTQYPPLKKVFFMESKYNPVITHSLTHSLTHSSLTHSGDIQHPYLL